MNTPKLIACGVLAWGICAGIASSPGAQSATTAFVGVSALPMDKEAVLADQTVIVRDGKIETITPSAKAQIPAGAVRIDGKGKFLMPGLAEMHAHIPGGQAPDSGVERTLFLYVASGITTIRGMLGHPRHLTYRDRAARGEIVSPLIYTSGPSFNAKTASTKEMAVEAVICGFFSKDEILWQAFSSPHGHFLLWLVAAVAAGMTAFYMFRALFMTFFGQSRVDEHAAHHLHESPKIMTIPLWILAVRSVIGGLVGIPHVLGGANQIHEFSGPGRGRRCGAGKSACRDQLPVSGLGFGRRGRRPFGQRGNPFDDPFAGDCLQRNRDRIFSLCEKSRPAEAPDRKVQRALYGGPQQILCGRNLSGPVR